MEQRGMVLMAARQDDDDGRQAIAIARDSEKDGGRTGARRCERRERGACEVLCESRARLTWRQGGLVATTRLCRTTNEVGPSRKRTMRQSEKRTKQRAYS